VVYASAAIGPARVCGVPALYNLTAIPDADAFQIVVYLYSFDPATDEGYLITHGTRTLWDAKAGEPYRIASIDMHTCCFDVPAKHALALGLDMYDSLYKPANTNVSISVEYNKGSPVAATPYAATQ